MDDSIPRPGPIGLSGHIPSSLSRTTRGLEQKRFILLQAWPGDNDFDLVVNEREHWA